MKEEYLHYLWKTKNIPLNNLSLTDGRPVSIISFGIHNHNSGPDFSNGTISIDGMTWIGNIEIHINSSDWYKHNHQSDPAYENVILHVVYNHDKPLYINNEEIPTLELKNYIQLAQFEHYNKLLTNQKWISCQEEIQTIEVIHISSQIESAVIQRLERKKNLISSRFKALNFDLNQLIIEQVASILGTKVNRLPMQELIQKIPLTIYWKENKEMIEAIFLVVANLLPTNKNDSYIEILKKQGEFYRVKYNLHQMNPASWKFFGTRTPGFPPFRIAQLAALLTNQKFFDFLNTSIEEWLNWFLNEEFSVNEYWNTHYHFGVKTKMHKAKISNNTKDLIIINVIVPIMYWWGIYQHNEIWTEKAFNLLEFIKPENNEIMKKWKKLGLSLISAKDSQGLLELKNEFCIKKKCLSCKIGHQLFKQ